MWDYYFFYALLIQEEQVIDCLVHCKRKPVHNLYCDKYSTVQDSIMYFLYNLYSDIYYYLYK